MLAAAGPARRAAAALSSRSLALAAGFPSSISAVVMRGGCVSAQSVQHVRWASASSRKSKGQRGPPTRPLGIIGEAGADTDEQLADVARWSVDGHGDGRAEAAAAARAAAAAAASAQDSGVTSLRANPYGWEEQIPRSAPLWMLYEAAREEQRLPEDRSGAASRLRDNPTEIRIPERDSKGRAYATGRRKEAVARVWVRAGDGAITVNGQTLADHFKMLSSRQHLLEPLVVTQTCGAVDVMITVKSGGYRGQAGAIRHGLANALARYDPYLKPALRRFKLIQRDPRMVERKKPGQKKARKQFQWIKR